MALVDTVLGWWHGVKYVYMQGRVIAVVSDGYSIYPLPSNCDARRVAAQALWLDPSCGDKSSPHIAKPRLPFGKIFFHISESL